MTNPHRGEVNVNLAGQTYKTKLNLDSIARIESQLGKSIVKTAQTLAEGNMTVNEIAAILHKAIRGGGNNIDLKDVNNIIWEAGLADSMKACGEILAGVFGVQEDDSGNEDGASE